jgi:hypothetical protein
MTTSGINKPFDTSHLFEIVEVRRFCGGLVAGLDISVTEVTDGARVVLEDFVLSPNEARSISAALLAAADAAEANGARIK